VPAHAQIRKGCIGINYVGADSSNPFTAEYRTTSTMPSPAGVPKTIVQREDVARDSQGRIRFERHGVARPPDDRKTVTLETPDGKPFTVTQEEFGTLIHISDCASGTSVVLQPGLRIATVKEGNGAPAIGLIALRKFRAARLGLPGDRALKYESTPVFRPWYMVSRILKLTRSPYIHR
jgi:hypothetical protein